VDRRFYSADEVHSALEAAGWRIVQQTRIKSHQRFRRGCLLVDELSRLCDGIADPWLREYYRSRAQHITASARQFENIIAPPWYVVIAEV
jgi:hypothetical protein